MALNNVGFVEEIDAEFAVEVGDARVFGFAAAVGEEDVGDLFLV